jgi:hypothetical protein
MKPILLVVLPVIFVISGCASTYTSSGVIPQAGGMFIIILKSDGGVSSYYFHKSYDPDSPIKNKVYKEAAEYCAKLNKKFNPINYKGGELEEGRIYGQIEFRCLNNGDPDLGKPIDK